MILLTGCHEAMYMFVSLFMSNFIFSRVICKNGAHECTR